MEKSQKIIFSGIQPSGTLTIGNYLGALKNWAPLSEEYNCFYCIVDMHAITVRQDPAQLRARSLSTLALYIACGLDPEKNTLFLQSHVPAHAELAWALSCYTMFGELSRMTQFKDKSAKNGDNINAGLFTYPALMAADILLYQADLVPVGDDQKQHLELARDVAIRFNNAYSPTFVVPEGYIPKVGARIMDLQDPTLKMSKSNPNGAVAILDKKEDILRKFKRAVTDSDSVVKFLPGKDGINNLMNIYSGFTGKNFEEIEHEFDGHGYGDFKQAVGEAVADGLEPVRLKHAEMLANKDYLDSVLKSNAEKAARTAHKTLSKVYRKIGFYIGK